jgi:hypothetical protein
VQRLRDRHAVVGQPLEDAVGGAVVEVHDLLTRCQTGGDERGRHLPELLVAHRNGAGMVDGP